MAVSTRRPSRKRTRTGFRFPEVSRPFSATPAGGSHQPRACLTRVSLRPRASSAPRRVPPPPTWPVCFNRLHSWGSPLPRFPRRGSPPPLGGASPLAISTRPPLEGPSIASGVSSPRRIRPRAVWVSPPSAGRARLGFSLLEALPSRASDLAGDSMVAHSPASPDAPCGTPVSAGRGPPLRHFRQDPVSGCLTLCSRVSKNTGIGLSLARLPAPPRFSSSSRRPGEPGRGCRTG